VCQQSPKSECGRGQIQVSERALREENWVESSADYRCDCDFRIRNPLRQSKNAEQSKCRNQQHRCARNCGGVCQDFPRQSEVGHNQRRMRVRRRGVWDQTSLQKQIAGRGDVVSGLIPKIRQAQQRNMKRRQREKQHRKNQRGRVPAPLLEVSAHRTQFSVPVPQPPSADPALSLQTCFHIPKHFVAESTSAPWLAAGLNRCAESF